MSDVKKTDKKAKTTGQKVQPGTNASTGKQSPTTAGADDVLKEKNPNQPGGDNHETGQENNQPTGSNQPGASTESPLVDNPLETSTTGAQGGENDNNKVKKESKRVIEYRRIAKDVFKKNGRLSTVYFTSDSIPFASENDALKHAAKLSDKTVIPVNRN